MELIRFFWVQNREHDKDLHRFLHIRGECYEVQVLFDGIRKCTGATFDFGTHECDFRVQCEVPAISRCICCWLLIALCKESLQEPACNAHIIPSCELKRLMECRNCTLKIILQ